MKLGTKRGESPYGFYPPKSDKSPAAREARRLYQQKWNAAHHRKTTPIDNNGDRPMSKWAQRAAERRAKAEAAKAHPMAMNSCPQCGAEFFRKVHEDYEPMSLTGCESCGIKFWFTKKGQE